VRREACCALHNFTKAGEGGNKRGRYCAHQDADKPQEEHKIMTQTTPNEGAQSRCCLPQRRRRWVGVLALAVAGFLGFAAGKVYSSPWLHHWGFGPPDAQEITYFVQHRVDKALSKVNATQEQRDKADAIVKAAVNDVYALKKDPAARRDKVVAILKADTVDRAALEEIRAERLDAAGVASKRIVQAVADIAEVLKPEQRRELLADWERWHQLP
jgi:Spy/CpxP family protein refolding chaperone